MSAKWGCTFATTCTQFYSAADHLILGVLARECWPWHANNRGHRCLLHQCILAGGLFSDYLQKCSTWLLALDYAVKDLAMLMETHILARLAERERTERLVSWYGETDIWTFVVVSRERTYLLPEAWQCAPDGLIYGEDSP